MKSTVETLSPTRVRLAIEVPFEELKPSLDSAYKRIGSSVKVPGFRPGKVPNRVIDQRVGRAAILEEAVNDALPRLYTDAVRENEVKALGQPDIDVTNLDDNVSLSFTAEVDVRPEIELPELSSIAVTVDDVEVTDADVDEQLESLRVRFGTLSGVDRPAAIGDFVSLDLKAEVDGEVVEGGTANGLSYEVGNNDLIDGLDDTIVGLSAADSAVFTTSSPKVITPAPRPRSASPSTRSRSASYPRSTTSSPSWRASSTPSMSCGPTCGPGSGGPRRSGRAARRATRCSRS